MPSYLHFGEDDFLRCRFALSPLWETQEAVRTLRHPYRHGYHSAWLRRAASAAAGLDLTPLWLVMPRIGHSPDWLGPPPVGPATDFEEELAAIRAADPAVAREDTARALADTPGALESPLGRAWMADPGRMVQELTDVLEAAWHSLVEPDWPRLRTLLESDIAFRSRRLAEVGLGGLLPEISPRLSWHARTLTLRPKGTHDAKDSYAAKDLYASKGTPASRDPYAAKDTYERHLGGKGLVLMPSVFVWPDVVTGFEEPWQPAVVYPARGIGGLWTEASADAADALVRLLGRGRAAVLAALDEPATTSALARRLRLAPSSVSAHLTTLRDAGLLVSRRYGHQVLYERTPLGMALASGGTG